MSAYLKNKWVAIGALLIYAIIGVFYYNSNVKPILAQVTPDVVEFIKPFTPLTIKNGEIVNKEDIIEKDVSVMGHKILKVVLNPKIDTYSPADLKEPGIYISKKYAYYVQGFKQEVRPLSTLGDMELNEQTLNSFLELMDKFYNSLPVLIFLGCLIFLPIFILIYSILTYLVMLILKKTKFSQIYAINTVFYVIIALLSHLIFVRINAILWLIIFVVINYIYAKTQEQDDF